MDAMPNENYGRIFCSSKYSVDKGANTFPILPISTTKDIAIPRYTEGNSSAIYTGMFPVAKQIATFMIAATKPTSIFSKQY